MFVFIKARPINNIVGIQDYILNKTGKQEHLISTFNSDTDFRAVAKYEENKPNNKTQGREYTVALPNEWLNIPKNELEENTKEIIEKLIGKEKQLWSAAIHLNSAESNLHCHIIFSEREIEKAEYETYKRDVWLTVDGLLAKRKDERHTLIHQKGDLKLTSENKPVLKDFTFTSKDRKYADKKYMRDIKQNLKDYYISKNIEITENTLPLPNIIGKTKPHEYRMKINPLRKAQKELIENINIITNNLNEEDRENVKKIYREEIIEINSLNNYNSFDKEEKKLSLFQTIYQTIEEYFKSFMDMFSFYDYFYQEKEINEYFVPLEIFYENYLGMNAESESLVPYIMEQPDKLNEKYLNMYHNITYTETILENKEFPVSFIAELLSDELKNIPQYRIEDYLDKNLVYELFKENETIEILLELDKNNDDLKEFNYNLVLEARKYQKEIEKEEYEKTVKSLYDSIDGYFNRAYNKSYETFEDLLEHKEIVIANTELYGYEVDIYYNFEEKKEKLYFKSFDDFLIKRKVSIEDYTDFMDKADFNTVSYVSKRFKNLEPQLTEKLNHSSWSKSQEYEIER